MSETTSTSSDFDALLVLSFGGPEGNEEVIPFLENVTHGRGIPRERLAEVGKHYFHFDGVSPLNDLNRQLIDQIESVLAEHGRELPVYFGNRNWHPFATDTAEQMAEDGVRNVAVFATSAWGGYSACRQYDEDIEKVRQHLADKGLPEITFTKLRQFFDHPTFISGMAQSVSRAIDQVPQEDRDQMAVLFSAHSVPNAHDDVGGAEGDKNLYSRQVHEAARLIANKAGLGDDYSVVWQSRSGSPHTPWLEPDVVDYTTDIAQKQGIRTVVVCPVGFIADHMEVIWDLDTELVEAADELGVRVVRTETLGTKKEFAEMAVGLLDELESGAWDKGDFAFEGTVTVQGCTTNGRPCAAGCCDIWNK